MFCFFSCGRQLLRFENTSAEQAKPMASLDTPFLYGWCPSKLNQPRTTRLMIWITWSAKSRLFWPRRLRWRGGSLRNARTSRDALPTGQSGAPTFPKRQTWNLKWSLFWQAEPLSWLVSSSCWARPETKNLASRVGSESELSSPGGKGDLSHEAFLFN